ncbi:MAG: adenylyltransferase/cytidyltransferase family protein [Phycisphaeraceae bacterium]|nr:adenylyltransferase/cytidyltransferase family protein [Phycisphaeraceae bacterium]
MTTPCGDSPKILTLAGLRAVRADLASAGRRLVQCHGCFDIVHPGHVRHLQQAKRLGDALLVTVTADAGVGKGPGRPLFSDDLRAESLAALDCVDFVHVDHHPTAADLLAETRPDVYIKGREYETNLDPRFAREREVVESFGGRVVFSSGDVVFSSTALIDSMESEGQTQHNQIRRLLTRHGITHASIPETLASFRGRRVAVIGECITDTYHFCDRPDIAGESPIMTLRPLETRSYDGGAAIIARHLAALGARPVLVTGHPATRQAAALRRRLDDQGVETRWVLTGHELVEKQRYLVGQQKVMKVDLCAQTELDASQQRELLDLAEDACGGCEAAIIADFGQGLLTGEMIRRLCLAVREKVNVLTGDVSGRRSSLANFRGADALCPSEPELRDATHDHASGLSAVAWGLMRTTRSNGAIVTMGAEGLIAFERLPEIESDEGDWRSRIVGEHVPALCPAPIDALGCGDAMLAVVTLGLASGLTLSHSATLGAVAAAQQARRIGNVVVGSDELRGGLERLCETRLATVRLPARGAQLAAPALSPVG